MKEFLESRESKKIQLHLGLSIILLSLVATIKGGVNSGNTFQFLDCLSIGVSAFLITFIGMFGNEKNFDNWKELFNKKSKGEKIFFLISPIILLLLLSVFYYLFNEISSFFKYLNKSLGLHQEDYLIINNTDIFRYFMTLVWNFVCYIVASMTISMELTFIGIIFFDRISEYYSQIGEKKEYD